MMERIEVLDRISAILDGHCFDCPIKKEFMKSSNRQQARADKYCSSQCDHGIRLQKLGEMLPCRERKLVRWEWSKEEANDLA